MRQSVDFAADPLLLLRDKIALLKTASICYLMEHEERSSHAYRMIRIVGFCEIFISDFTVSIFSLNAVRGFRSRESRFSHTYFYLTMFKYILKVVGLRN